MASSRSPPASDVVESRKTSSDGLPTLRRPPQKRAVSPSSSQKRAVSPSSSTARVSVFPHVTRRQSQMPSPRLHRANHPREDHKKRRLATAGLSIQQRINLCLKQVVGRCIRFRPAGPGVFGVGQSFTDRQSSEPNPQSRQRSTSPQPSHRVSPARSANPSGVTAPGLSGKSVRNRRNAA